MHRYPLNRWPPLRFFLVESWGLHVHCKVWQAQPWYILAVGQNQDSKGSGGDVGTTVRFLTLLWDLHMAPWTSVCSSLTLSPWRSRLPVDKHSTHFTHEHASWEERCESFLLHSSLGWPNRIPALVSSRKSSSFLHNIPAHLKGPWAYSRSRAYTCPMVLLDIRGLRTQMWAPAEESWRSLKCQHHPWFVPTHPP